MASVLDDVLGGGEAAGGEAAAAAIETVAGAEAVAAAMAMNAAGYGPGVAAAAESFLKSQNEVLRLQIHSHHAESRLRKGLLRGQHFSQLLRIALQVFTAVTLTGVGVVLLTMFYNAASSKSVVVEPFDAPPALAARGLSGKVVAGGVLDALTRLQSVTRSSAAQRNLTNAWTNDIKVEVPETGLSVGDITRVLKAQFGHDIHIEGDLVQTDTGGLALTIRGDGTVPKTFEGGASDLDKLMTEAAEYVYGQSQPALYVSYLSESGRDKDAVAFAKQAYAMASATDRPYILNIWAISLQNLGVNPRQTLALLVEAIRLKPDFWVGYANLQGTDITLGDEEGAWREGEVMRAVAGGRPGRAPEVEYLNVDILTWNLLAWRDGQIADVKAHSGIGSTAESAGVQIADVDWRLHDPVAAELELQTAQSDGSDPTVPAATHFVHGRIATEEGDMKKAAAEMEAFGAAYSNPTVATNYPGYNCWIAPAEEAAGHPDKADAVLKSGGRYVDCYRFRADILDHRGDWGEAQKAYAAAVAVAPDLPAAYYSWGMALARHGDLAGAVAKLDAAHARGPNWADPLKAWGDVLARERHWSNALAKYDEALKDAPAWAALHQARDAAAKHAN